MTNRTKEGRSFAYSEWIWRGVILLVLTGQLWVSTRFVSVEEFRALFITVHEVRDKVLVIEQAVNGADRVASSIGILEARVRDLELAAAGRESRVRDLEKTMPRKP